MAFGSKQPFLLHPTKTAEISITDKTRLILVSDIRNVKSFMVLKLKKDAPNSMGASLLKVIINRQPVQM